MELSEAQYRLIEDCLPRQRGNIQPLEPASS